MARARRAVRNNAPEKDTEAEPETTSQEPVEEEEQEVATREQDAVMAEGLQFDLPLTWRAGKPIAVSELLNRLQSLSQELIAMDQELADRETLVPKAQELANPQLLNHKDKGVKAWAMLCIVEMFRLLAPDAPYKGGQLKSIFDLFASGIVTALASPSDPYNQQHTSILQSLTSFKSIVLITDIPGSDHLILRLFTNCFDVLSGTIQGAQGEQLPRNVEYHMTKMLVTIVEESDSLPSEVPDVILAQFLRVDPHALLPTNQNGDTSSQNVMLEPSPAYNMARSICNTCANKMGPLVGSYFGSVLVDVSQSFTTSKPSRSKGRKRTHDDSEDLDDSGMTPPVEVDLDDVDKAHRLLRELWRSSPDVIHNVIEHLDIEFSTENVSLRVLAVQTVGDMIAGIGSAGPPSFDTIDPAAYPPPSLEDTPNSTVQHVMVAARAPHAFSAVYPSTYQAFLSRHADKAGAVRSAWVTAVGRILVTSGGGKGLDQEQEAEFLRYFSQRLVDSDEYVRLAAVQAIGEFDFVGIVTKLGKSGSMTKPDSILCNLAERIKDRNQRTRMAAMEILGRIWGGSAGEIAAGNEQVRELLGSAPSTILLAMYLNKPEVNALVLRVLWESLLPVGFPPIKSKSNGTSQLIPDSQGAEETHVDPDAIRTERVLVLVRDLQDKARGVFFSILGQQNLRAKYLDSYLRECEAFAGGDCDADEKANIKSRLDKLSGALSKFTPDPSLAVEHLQVFAQSFHRRCYALIRFAFAPDSDYKKVTNALKELKKRMEDGTPVMAAAAETIIPLTRNSAKLVYNKCHMPAIMEYARTDKQGLGGAAHEVLKELSLREPEVFKGHVLELCNTLKKQAPTETTTNDSSAADTLKACAGFAKRFSKEMPNDREFSRAMVAYAKYSHQPKAAKHAVSIIVVVTDKKEMYLKELIDYSIKDFDVHGDHVLAKLATLAQIQLIANTQISEHSDALLDIAVAKVLKSRPHVDEDDLDWKIEIDDDLSSKILALKMLVNGIRGLDTSGEVSEAYERLKPQAERVYKLLNTLIDRDGELSPAKTTPKYMKARLRLTSAIQLSKLSCNPVFDRFLRQSDFNDLTKISQDPRPEVRHSFLDVLKKYLVQGKLPPRFYSLVFIYAFEPSKNVKEATISWLRGRATMFAREEFKVMEGVFPRFLSLLAHHQDFSAEEQDLEETVEYIIFFLRSVATEENIAVFHHVAQRLKTVEDGLNREKSKNLYIISDITEAAIRHFCDIKGWSLQLYSGRVPLPSGLFARLSGHVAAQEISETRYAPEELLERLDDIVKQILKPKKRKAEGTGEPTPKRAKAAATDSSARKSNSRPAKVATKKKTKARSTSAVDSAERRRSSRVSKSKNYAEDSDSPMDDDDQDEEVEDEDEDEEASDDQVSDGGNDEDGAEVEEPDEGNKENLSTESVAEDDEPTPVPTSKRRTASSKTAATPKSAPEKVSRQNPGRGSRVTPTTTRANGRRTRARKEVMDLPSSSDEEMS